ncbi:MAG: DegT/DnrJ/EryC1/StrS family aminotransferase [Spirochaetia bacterium]|nr:DegT/DnrJ/EryC1/StrS family aminotransferase [Spirochaetia bacterium]
MVPFIDLKSQYKIIQKNIGDAIKKVLDHGQYINGPEIIQLEEMLARYVGAKHCIVCSSGTDALLMALMAIEIKPGDEIITTPFTFIATAEVVALIGATPVFVDIDSKTYNIDPALIEKKITKRTKAIMPVSLYGQCADFDSINKIAASHNIPVIEDAAQSFGAEYNGRKSCALSTIGCTSFFPSKPLGAYGDGGAIFTDNDDLAKLFKQIREHGQDRRYNHPVLGLNARMDSIQAAVLIAKMSIFPGEIAARIKIGENYSRNLGNVATTPFIARGNSSVYAQYTILIENRDTFAENLKENGIPTAVHYPIPLHLQPVFAYLKEAKGSYPVSERTAEQVISLPMHPYLSGEDQIKIIDSVKRALKK